MIRLGIWSYSNHFRYKVFPSIKNNRKIDVVAILSNKKKDKNSDLKNIKWFKNKKSFFDFCNLDYVYISSVNSKHFLDCKYALNKNVNVICEKPMCLNLDELNKLKNIAKERERNIFEMTQYTSHPLFIKLRKILSSKKIGEISKVKSSFKIPLNDRKNFRFHNGYGGGALFDVGYYPISTMFTLFDSKKIEIEKIKLNKENKLDMAGNLLTKNEKGIRFYLKWGFNSSYENYINIFGKRGKIKVNFIFSKSVQQNAKIEILKKNTEIVNIETANQINLAFNDIFFKKKFKKKMKFSSQILQVIEKIKN